MSIITEEGSRSVAKMFDLSLIDLATVFGEVIMFQYECAPMNAAQVEEWVWVLYTWPELLTS